MIGKIQAAPCGAFKAQFLLSTLVSGAAVAVDDEQLKGRLHENHQ